jgi:hypothetical protein
VKGGGFLISADIMVIIFIPMGAKLNIPRDSSWTACAVPMIAKEELAKE